MVRLYLRKVYIHILMITGGSIDPVRKITLKINFNVNVRTIKRR